MAIQFTCSKCGEVIPGNDAVTRLTKALRVLTKGGAPVATIRRKHAGTRECAVRCMKHAGKRDSEIAKRFNQG